MFEEYKKQRIKEIQDMFHCSEEQAIGVFHELPDDDFEKWKNKQKLSQSIVEEIMKSMENIDFGILMNEYTKILIANGLICKSIGLLKKLTESEDE